MRYWQCYCSLGLGCWRKCWGKYSHLLSLTLASAQGTGLEGPLVSCSNAIFTLCALKSCDYLLHLYVFDTFKNSDAIFYVGFSQEYSSLHLIQIDVSEIATTAFLYEIKQMLAKLALTIADFCLTLLMPTI